MGQSVRSKAWLLALCRRPTVLAATLLVALLLVVNGARSLRAAETGTADSGKIGLELNRLEAAGDGCRLSFVFRNGMAGTIEAMALELVLFDDQDRVAGLIAIDAGRLPAGKMRVRQFDIAQTACSGIKRVLVNDVTACKGSGLASATCLDAVAVSSRAGIELVN